MSNYDEAKERENFATNLRYWMDIKGYSKIGLAEKLDVTPSAVTHWCDGTKMPRSRGLHISINFVPTLHFFKSGVKVE